MRSSRDLLAELRSLHSARIDLSLGRLRRLLRLLGDPQRRLPPVIHIAGTNGKGSVLALLRAMLEADGRRVHAYVSPPLGRMHDSIQLAHTGDLGVSGPIDDDRLVELLGRVLAANAGAPLTSFEGETSAAFLAFAETPADAVLLETGMGGRDDATNVVEDPVVTIITPVARDHESFLGGTLAEIARHKAGILKPGVPCVLGRQEPEACAVIEARAKAVRAPLIAFGSAWDAYEQHGRMVFQHEVGLMDLPLPALKGRHQIENAGTAIAATLRLGSLAPGEAAIERGLQQVRWPARLQPLPLAGPFARLAPGSEVWLDGGHNRAAAVALAQAMAELEERMARPLHLVVGMLTSKDPADVLAPFRGLARLVIGVPIPDVSRAYADARDPADIAEVAAGLGFRTALAGCLAEAVALSVEIEPGPVRMLVAGSFHLAGHVLAEVAEPAGAAGR